MKDVNTTPSTSSAEAPKPAETPKAADAPVVPETYTEFKAPEGITLSKETLAAATPLFKELGLSQEGAQKLVDFHTSQMKAAAEGPLNTVIAMRTQWQTETKADPVIGHRLDEVRQEISRAFDTIGDPAIVDDFKKAMNLTGVGDNPAFIKAFYKLAQKIPKEGAHVQGSAPSKHGQDASGQSKAPSVAKAMYPNLA